MKVFSYFLWFIAYKNRKYIAGFFGSLVLFIVFNFMMSDFLDLNSSINLLVLKWGVNLGLFGVMGFCIYKIIKKETKSKVLTKKTLTSRSDLIIKKYKESK